jgi:hypothetical protein
MTAFVFTPPHEIHADRVQTGFQVTKGRKTLLRRARRLWAHAACGPSRTQVSLGDNGQGQ